jgi:hypothetical protein
VLDRERSVEADLDDPHLLVLGHEVLDRLVGGLGPGAHQHDHALGLGMAHVVEEVIAPPDPLAEAGHGLLDDVGAGVVEAVAGLAGLEEGVGVLGGAAQDRTLGVEGPLLMGPDELVRQHEANVVVRQLLDLADLVRAAEAVEEVEEGHPRLEGSGSGDEREVVRLLHRPGGREAEADLPAGHHVRVIAEDRQGVGGDGAGGHVHGEGRQLSRDLVHVRDHEQQALRRGERRGQRASLQCAVHRPGGTAFGLHLDDVGHDAPDVLLAAGRPLVGQLAHRRGRRDRVDRDHLTHAVRDRGRGLVPVHRDHLPGRHSVTSRQYSVLSPPPLHDAGQAGRVGLAPAERPFPARIAGGGANA